MNHKKKIDSKQALMDELEKYDAQAYQLGYELKDYEEWYARLPYYIRIDRRMKVIKESYDYGLETRVQEDMHINRLSVFIQSANSLNQTDIVMEALKGKRVLRVYDGPTGRFNDLSPATDAIVINYDNTSKLFTKSDFNMADNYIYQVCRRKNDITYWCGRYLIILTTLTFREWVERCGLKTTEYDSLTNTITDTESYRSVHSKFYICHIEEMDGIKRLFCTSPSRRGTAEQQLERKDYYIDFRDKLNHFLAIID